MHPAPCTSPRPVFVTWRLCKRCSHCLEPAPLPLLNDRVLRRTSFSCSPAAVPNSAPPPGCPARGPAHRQAQGGTRSADPESQERHALQPTARPLSLAGLFLSPPPQSGGPGRFSDGVSENCQTRPRYLSGAARPEATRDGGGAPALEPGPTTSAAAGGESPEMRLGQGPASPRSHRVTLSGACGQSARWVGPGSLLQVILRVQ